MTATAERVLHESRRFRAALPMLLKSYAGRWVIYKDDHVVEAFDDEDAAYEAAVQEFGPDGGFVVAQVVVEETPVLTAAVYFSRFLTA